MALVATRKRADLGAISIGDVFNSSVANAATATADVTVAGYTRMVVVWQLLATTTTADLNTPGVKPYRSDGSTIILQNLPTVASVAAASDATNVVQTNTYDVTGLSVVRVQATNNNAGSKTLLVSVFLGTNR